MGWIIFTAVDLYIGIVVLDVMARSGSIPAEKLPRLQTAKKIIWVCLALTAAAIVVKLLR